MSNNSVNLLCITPCNEKQYIDIIITFIKHVADFGELFFVDDGNTDRHIFFSSLKISNEIKNKIHYFFAPECTTPEKKVELLEQHANGDLWHFITPGTLYSENHFQALLNQSVNKIIGSTLKPVYIPPLDYLCNVKSRTPYFSHLSSLSFHRSHYEKQGIWFNTQGDEASLGKPFVQLDTRESPVTIIDELTVVTETGLLQRSNPLPRNTISASLPVPRFQHKINWSLLEKIVYIKTTACPEREYQFLEKLDELKIPKEKIISINAIQTDIESEGHVLSHIAVLQKASEKKWKNILILEDDIFFVQSTDADKQLNNFLTLLSNIEWDVAMLSANYQNTSTLVENKNILKINAAMTTGAYAVNSHYYDTLITTYTQGLQQQRNTKQQTNYGVDVFWKKLIPSHRWFGIWPCFAFKENSIKNINRIHSFFQPLVSILPETHIALEEKHLARFHDGTAIAEDYHILERIYRYYGMFEIADFFHHHSMQDRNQYRHNSNWPLLSVLITTYNQVDVLMKTLDSVLHQRYPNMEIIVIDDASTDNTAIRLAEINDSRLTIVRNKLNQKGNNHRQGLEQYTKGKYLFIIDHDDLLLDRDYLMDAVIIMEQDKSLAFVFARHSEWHEHRNRIINTHYGSIDSQKIAGKDYFINLMRPGYPNIMFLTSVIRRSVAIKMGAIVREGIVDYHLYPRLMLAGNVGFIDRISSLYRIHQKSNTFNLNNPTDIHIDELFMQHLTETVSLANKNGFTRAQLEEWFIRVASSSFANWRLPNIIRGKGFELAMAILSMLQQKYPQVGIRTLATLFRNYK